MNENIGGNVLINERGYEEIRDTLDAFFHQDGSSRRMMGVKPLDFILEFYEVYTETCNNPNIDTNVLQIPMELYHTLDQHPAFYSAESLFHWLKDLAFATKFQRRHYYNIPLGVMFEEIIASRNPEWEQTKGDIDRYGKVDFIDWKNKTLYTVKTSLNFDYNIFRDIRDWLSRAVDEKYRPLADWTIKGLWYQQDTKTYKTITDRRNT